MNLSTWTQHHKAHKISMYNRETTLKLTEMDFMSHHLAKIRAINNLDLLAVYPIFCFNFRLLNFHS